MSNGRIVHSDKAQITNLIWIYSIDYTYHNLSVNSCSYYEFQVEISAATNRESYIEIACKT